MSAKVKEAFLSCSAHRLRRLKGFPEALRALCAPDVPNLAKGPDFVAACRLAAARHTKPEGRVLVRAIKQGRRTIGHEVGDLRSALVIAHEAAARRTMRVSLEGPLAAKVAKRSGLRTTRLRRWDRDDGRNMELAALADRFAASWDPWMIEGDNQQSGLFGEGLERRWFAAVILPVMEVNLDGSRRRDLQALVVCDPEGAKTRRLVLPGVYDEFEPLTETAIREAIAAAWATNDCDDEKFKWNAGSEAAETMAAALGGKWPETSEMSFWMRIKQRHERRLSITLAGLRRMLPVPVSEHAALCGKQFADLKRTAGFLLAREAWTVETYRRANQAIRTVPWLKHFIRFGPVAEAVSKGQALSEVIRIAACAERGVHRKTVESLKASWRQSGDEVRTAERFAKTVAILEEIYREDPHRPVFGASGLSVIQEVVFTLPLSTRFQTDAVLALRDASGQPQRVQDIVDVLGWLGADLGVLIFGEEVSQDPEHTFLNELACRILFPPGRTHAGVAAASKSWHEGISRFGAERRSIVVAGHAKAVDLPGEEALRRRLFPHFMKQSATVDGVAIEPLADSDSLYQEGSEMDHCVGTSYEHLAAQGISLIMSLKSRYGRSTAEVRIEGGGQKNPARFVIIQNRAHSNEEPPQEHTDALSRLLKVVNRDHGAIAKFVEDARSARQAFDILQRRGLSTLPPEFMEELKDLIFSFLRRNLPKRQRAMSRHEWVAAAQDGSLWQDRAT